MKAVNIIQKDIEQGFWYDIEKIGGCLRWNRKIKAKAKGSGWYLVFYIITTKVAKIARTAYVFMQKSSAVRFLAMEMEHTGESNMRKIMWHVCQVDEKDCRKFLDTVVCFRFCRSGYMLGGYIITERHVSFEDDHIRDTGGYTRRPQQVSADGRIMVSKQKRQSSVLVTGSDTGVKKVLVLHIMSDKDGCKRCGTENF